MSLRALIFFVLAILALLTGAFIYLSFPLLESSIVDIFPSALQSSSMPAIHLVLTEIVAGIILMIVTYSLVFFGIISSWVATPLQRIIKAMNAFSADGSKLFVKRTPGAPSEIGQLIDGYSSLITKVEVSAHKDTDVSVVKSDFISTAAHQLRTPLTGVRWALEGLQKENLTESQKALLTGAIEKTHELVSIVGTLLDISAVGPGKTPYAFAISDLGSLIDEVVSEHEPQAQKASLSLFYAKSGSVLPKIQMDREKIKTVLNTLIENAIRYTPAPGSVRITADAQEGRAYIRVKDTGIGIPEKNRDNIFERFYRAENATATQTTGNGLSLSIARSIAIDHNGDLNFVANMDGPGMTFVLTLPVAS